jgi:hypothetical protein
LICCFWGLGQGPRAKGPLKKKPVTPVVGGWVRGQKTEKDQDQIYLFDSFSGVFELPSPRNAQKRDKNKSRKNRFCILDFWSIFL